MGHQSTMMFRPSGMNDSAQQMGGSMTRTDGFKQAMLGEFDKLAANFDGGAGTTPIAAIRRDFERRVDEAIRSGNAAKVGLETSAEHGQQGMQLMTRTLSQSAI